VKGARPPAASAPAIVRLGAVESTQAVAFELAERGAADRTVVLADHQTAGRGRRGRAWNDEPGTGLLVSIVLRPRLALPRLPLLSYAAAIAVAEALDGVAALRPTLKWPNDVLVRDRKIAGILLESRIGAAAATVVVGIGVNLTQRRFPAELEGRATSIALETGRTVEREPVLGALLGAFDLWRGRLEADGFAPVRERWLALSETIGRRISVDGRAGLAVDVDLEGALLLQDGSGLRRVLAGPIEG
jgi:BirA family biotin operon repressor/biotin-[acetyl-CoA-carboxylase] ligase